MEAQKTAFIGIYNSRKELTGVVARDITTGKRIFYNCEEQSDDDILSMLNTKRNEKNEEKKEEN